MKKRNLILSIVLNGAIIASDVFALLYSLIGSLNASGQSTGKTLVEFFDHYTNLSNILLVIAASILLISSIVAYRKKKEIPAWAIAVDFIATVSVLTTFLVVLCLLVPLSGSAELIKGPYFLFVHIIDPLLAFVAFAFVEVTPELKKKQSWLCLIPLVIYTGIIAPLATFGKIDDPYGQVKLLNVTSDVWYNIAWKWCAIFFGTWLVGFLLLWLRQAMARVLNKEPEEKKTVEDGWTKEERGSGNPAYQEDRGPQATPTHEIAADDVVVVQDDEGSEEAEEAEEVKEEEEAKKTNPTGYMNRPRVYHIAKQNDTGKWQVRLATGQKAIKLFDTQEEAINYAKGLVKTQGGSIRVHSLKGKMRKE
jgi:hypothetical protein